MKSDSAFQTQKNIKTQKSVWDVLARVSSDWMHSAVRILRRKSCAMKCRAVSGLCSVSVDTCTASEPSHTSLSWHHNYMITMLCLCYLSHPKPWNPRAITAAVFLLGPRWQKNHVATGRHTQSSGKNAVWTGKLCHFSVKRLNGCSTSNLFPWQCGNSSGNTGSFLLDSQYKEENKNLLSIWMNKRRSIFQCKHVKPKSFPCPDHSKIHE